MTDMTLIEGPSAWVGRDVQPEDYRVELSAACHDEIRRAVDEMQGVSAADDRAASRGFRDARLPRADGSGARKFSITGVRFAIVDRLPVAEMDADEATAIYWLLSSMVSRPVAQKLDGTMIYDVLDTGQEALPGSGVRPDKTNIEIRFHNDNAYNKTPPDYVGLLCLRQARAAVTAA